ncbi:hypothetical protein SAMN02746019_00012270 [Thermoflexus hugenholtzii JAD2]|uniref:Coenzyme F420-dependent N5,N10-methylene tetrahydromethanopterin reductase and related flavin-dependent oxidoreductases n=2 Tax=Thermoflexus TaxID=1495649 RepID=A0A212RDS5_9CHLR|nr:hypothetical protein SAMN02746019_00012270 [Thermoflexus hugenholtzii JAD2]
MAVNVGAGNHEGAWSWASEAGRRVREHEMCGALPGAQRAPGCEYLAREGWRPEEVRRSEMTGLIFGRDPAEVRRKLVGRPEEALRAWGILIGTPSALREQVERLGEAGVQRVMLQWLELDDLGGLERLARALLEG